MILRPKKYSEICLLLAPLLLILDFHVAAQRAPVLANDKCSIKGVVVHAGTGEPLKKALVTLEKLEGRDLSYVASTDAAGRFYLKGIEPGRYRLRAERNGYVRQEYRQRAADRPGSILSLEPGQSLRDVTLRLVPTGAITGRIYDEDGEPLRGVRVRALRYSYEQGQRRLVQAAAALSNDLGEYRVYDLPPDHYYLSATYPPSTASGHSLDSVPREVYAPTYYPSTNDPTRAASIQLRAGEEARGLHFTLMPKRTVRIRGRVINTITGRPAHGAAVSIYPRESSAPGSDFRHQVVVEDAQGAFEIRGIILGPYFLAAHFSEEGTSFQARQPVDVTDVDLDETNLFLVPNAELRGHIRVEDNPQLRPVNLRIILQPRDDPEVDLISASPKADGAFVLKNVPGCVYDIGVAGMPEDFYIKAARLGSDNTLEAGLDLSQSRQPSSLELVLKSFS
jgi:hypothetical protein